MRLNPNSPNKTQLEAFQNRRAESILREVNGAYEKFSKTRNLGDGVILGTVHVPTACRQTQEGALSSDQIVNVDLSTYKGYFVAHNSSITLFDGTGYKTHSVEDPYYEIISPATSKYQFLTGEAKDRITKAIVDSVEVSSTPPYEGFEIILDEIILPILFDAKVDVRESIDDLPLNCRLSSKHSISSVVERLLEGAPLQQRLVRRLNPSHSVLIGQKHLTFFERGTV